jgi:hypothetical protein
MYAAIEDPNNVTGDLYTSGSETYAQIQTPVCMTVSVEINAIDFDHSNSVKKTNNSNMNSNHDEYDSGKQYHSRQASSSSCTNLIGSPKPEKRQANSPLPPTPPRNSAPFDHRDNANRLKDSNNNKARQDLEGMYAKVLKKSKLSNAPQPIMVDKIDNFNDPPQVHNLLNEDYCNEEKGFSEDLNDAGYETIPGDKNNNKGHTNFSFSVNQKRPSSISESNYEVVKKLENTIDSDYDPNYEIVMNKAKLDDSVLENKYSQIPEVTSINSNDYSQLIFNSIDSDANLYCSIPPVALDPINALSTDGSSSILEQNLSESSSTKDIPSKFTEHTYERLDEENSPDDFFKV